MSTDKEIIFFKTVCTGCKRPVRVFVQDEKQFPRCMYCGGELVIDDDRKTNVTKVVTTNKSIATLYDIEKQCPVCNRTVGGRGCVGDEFKCRFCGVNLKLMNSIGEVTPFSFGSDLKDNQTRKLFKTSNLSAKQADEVLNRIDELYSDFYDTTYSEIFKLIYIACEKNMYFRRFDIEYVRLIVLNLIPLFRNDILLQNNVFQFPTVADFSAELLSMFLFPKSPPVLKHDTAGYLMVYLTTSSFENIRHIHPAQVARMLSEFSITSTNVISLDKEDSYIEFEGVLQYKESVTNGEFFLRISKTNFHEYVQISDEGKQLLRTRFIESGLLITLVRLVYGNWFPAYALRHFSPEAIKRMFYRRTGEEIHPEAFPVLSRIITNLH